MRSLPRFVCSGSIAAFVVGSFLTPSAPAQTNIYWTGQIGNSWGDAPNWSTTPSGTGSATPSSSTIVNFNGAVSNQIGTLGGTRQVAGMHFLSNSTTPLVIDAAVNASTLTLFASSGTSGITVDSGAAAHRLNDILQFISQQVWTNSSTNAFTLGGTVNFTNANTNILFASGSTGGFKFDNAVNFNLQETLTNSNTSAPVVFTSNSVFNINNTAAGGVTLAGTGGFTLDGLVVFTNSQGGGILNLNSTGTTTLNHVQLSNDDVGKAETITVGAGAMATVNGVISNGASANATASSLTKAGTGKLVLAGANTFTGAIQVNDGTLSIASTGTLAGNGINFIPTAGASGTPFLEVNATALRLGTAIGYGANAGGNTANAATINGTGSITSTGTLNFTVNDSTNATRELAVNVPIVNDGSTARAVTKTGAGALVLDGANTFTGGFTLSQGTVFVRATPTAAGGFTMTPNGTAPTTLTLENDASWLLGGTITANGGATLPLSINAAPDSPSSELRLNSGAALTTRTFTIQDNTSANDDLTISVPIANGNGPANLYKDAPGRVVFRGDNTYTGATAFFRGDLVLDYSLSTGSKLSDTADVEPRGGTLTLRGSSTAAVNELVGFLSPGSSNVAGGSLTGTTASTGGTSTIKLQSNGNAVSLTFAGFRRNPSGGIVNLVPDPSVTGTEFRTTAANNASDLLATNALLNGRFIRNDGTGLIVAATGLLQNDPSQWLATQHIEMNASPAIGQHLAIDHIGALTVSPTAADVTFNVDNTVQGLTLSGGAILLAPEATKSVTISGGKILTELPYNSAAGVDLLLINNTNPSTGAILKISSNLGQSDGPLGNAQNITIGGTSIVELSGKSTSFPTYNSSTKLFGQVNILGGATLRVKGGDAVGDYLPINLGLNGDSGGTFDLDSTSAAPVSETIGGLLNAANTNQGTTQGTIKLGDGGVLTLNQTAAATFSGSLSGSGTLIKQGNAQLQFNPASTSVRLNYSGPLQILGGQIAFTSTNSAFSSFAGMSSVTDILLRGGEILSQQNVGGTDMQMINDSTILHLEGTINNGLQVSSNQTGRTEIVGALDLASSANVITVNANNTTSPLFLRFGASSNQLIRSAANHATVLMRGDALGANANAAQIIFNNGIGNVLVGGNGGAGTTTVSILPYAIGSAADNGAGESLVTYGANGFRPLVDSEYATFTAATVNDNVTISATGVPPGQVGKTINSLRFNTSGGSASLDGDTGANLVLNSGAILVSAGATTNGATLSGYDNIRATSNELVVNVTSSVAGPVASPASIATAADTVFTISSNISNGSGALSLTKSGTGTLKLDTATQNGFTGDLTVNQGVLSFTGSAALVGASKIRLAGGTLRWEGNTYDITSGSRPVELAGPSSFYTPTGTGAAGNALNRGNTLDVGINNVTLANSIGGGGVGGLVKTGTGSLTLSSAPSYTGSTVVMQGTMNFSGGINANTTSGLFIIPENTLVVGRVDITGGAADTPALLPVASTGSMGAYAVVANGLAVQQLMVGATFTNPIPGTGSATNPTANMAENSTGTLTVTSGAVTIGNGGGDSFFVVGYRDEGAANAGPLSNASAARINGQTYLPNTAPLASGSVNFSGASSVNINVARMLVGQNKGGGSVRTDGDVRFSADGSNTITAGSLVIGNSPGPDSTGAGGGGIVSNLLLGRNQNTLNVDTLVVGGQNSNGRISFLSGSSTPSFTLRDRSGNGGANVFVGDNDDITGTNQASDLNSLSLTGINVDAKLNLLVIGRHGGGGTAPDISNGGQGQGSGAGSLSFDTGVVEATTIKMAQTSYRSTSLAPLRTTGVINLGGLADRNPILRFQDLSKGGGTATFNWLNGTITNIPGADAVNRNVVINNDSDNGHHLFVESGRTMTFGAAAGFQGTGGLLKEGNGTLILFSENLVNGLNQGYAGETHLYAGKLLANNAFGFATGTSPIFVHGGAFLGGVGGHIGGVVTVESQGVIAPGAGVPGITNLGVGEAGGNLVMESNSTLKLDISTSTLTSDQLTIGSALNLASDDTVNLELTDLSEAYILNQTITLIKGGDYKVGGLFKVNGQVIQDYVAGVSTIYDSFVLGSNNFWIDYDAGPSGFDVALVAVPEPGALASLIGGVGMLVGLQRFRRVGSRRS